MLEHTHKHNQKYHYPSDKLNVCRVCNHYLEEGEPRYNDYFLFRYEPETIHQPICNFCADNQPDEQFKKFLDHPLTKKAKR